MISRVYSLTVSLVLADRQKKERHREAIKAQTAVRGGYRGREGGRKEGREGGGAFPGETGQAGYAEGEGGGEGGGETQGWLVPSRGCVLTGATYMQVSDRGGQNAGGSFCDVQCSEEEPTQQCAATNTRRHAYRWCTCVSAKQMISFNRINAHNTCKCRQEMTCTSPVLLAGGSLDPGNEIQFACCNLYRDKPLEDSAVCPVCKRISLSFSFSGSFLSAKPVLLTAFPQPDASSIYLSSPFPSPSLFSCPSLPLGTVWLVRAVIELPLFDQGGNRNCTLLTQLCRYVCVCVCKHIFQEGALIVCSYLHNVWLPAVCVCLITVYVSLQYPGFSV